MAWELLLNKDLMDCDITITAHYLNKDWKLKVYKLDFSRF